MRIEAVRVEGLLGSDVYEVQELQPYASLPPGMGSVSVADGLRMAFAALDGNSLPGVLPSMGVPSRGSVKVTEEGGMPDLVEWAEGTALRRWVSPAVTPAVKVEWMASMDPVLFGQLRTLAAREPRLVSALGGDARLTIKVGWLFNKEFDTATLSLLKLKIGDVAFPTTRLERPAWVSSFVGDVGRRFGALSMHEPVQEVVERLLQYSLSPEPEVRAAFARAAECFASQPFGYGRLQLVRWNGLPTACFGEALIPAGRFGSQAEHALRLVEMAICQRPDVLLMEPSIGENEAVEQWLQSLLTGEGATLEQVIRVPGGAA